jgi:hypothetical protein
MRRGKKKGGENMNRKISVIALSLSLILVIAVAAIAPALAHGDKKDKGNDSSYVTVYGQHGEVILQLPAGSPKVTNVTALRLIANEYDKKSTFGAYDTLVVALWIPIANTFVPVAQINNINDPDLDAYLHTLYSNTPVWNSLMPNVIDVSDKDLKVWKEGDVIMANLTTTVKITLPFNLMAGSPYVAWGNQTFNLPPLTLMFRPIAHNFKNEESVTLAPHPPLSGYTITVKSQMSPAWVKAEIPTWIKGASLECSGHICTHIVQQGIPPAA